MHFPVSGARSGTLQAQRESTPASISENATSKRRTHLWCVKLDTDTDCKLLIRVAMVSRTSSGISDKERLIHICATGV